MADDNSAAWPQVSIVETKRNVSTIKCTLTFLRPIKLFLKRSWTLSNRPHTRDF